MEPSRVTSRFPPRARAAYASGSMSCGITPRSSSTCVLVPASRPPTYSARSASIRRLRSRSRSSGAGLPPRTRPPAVSTASRSVWVISRSRLRSTSRARRAKLHAANPTVGRRKNAPRVTASRMRKERARLRQRGGRSRSPATSSAASHSSPSTAASSSTTSTPRTYSGTGPRRSIAA
jgi:hypothetical protein